MGFRTLTAGNCARLLDLVRSFVWLALCASCATSPEAPLSLATLSVNPQAHSARAQAGYISYNGTSYHRWTISFAMVEGCGADPVASVEIETLASTTDIAMGTTMLRGDQNMIATLPSGYLAYQAAPLVSGSVSVDTASTTFITGSLTSQLMIGGVATDVNGTFSAPICP
jgi:hypothetical protein